MSQCLAYLLLTLKNPLAAPVDQSAQSTRTGWKKRRARRLVSVSRPKASIPSMYCQTFPGKINIKKVAVAIPTCGRYFQRITSARPSKISTTPEARTTKSGSTGSQEGTWAWNSSLAEVRCRVPV